MIRHPQFVSAEQDSPHLVGAIFLVGIWLGELRPVWFRQTRVTWEAMLLRYCYSWLADVRAGCHLHSVVGQPATVVRSEIF